MLARRRSILAFFDVISSFSCVLAFSRRSIWLCRSRTVRSSMRAVRADCDCVVVSDSRSSSSWECC